MNPLPLFFALACAAPALPQSAATARANHEFESAKAAKKRGELETCALHLRRARLALAEATDAPKALKSSIDNYARRNDSRDSARTKSLRKAAKQLANIGTKYVEKGWLTLASQLAREAKALDAATAKPLLKALDEARTSAPSGGTLAEMFGDGERIWGGEGWRFEGAELRSPAYDKSKHLFIGSQRLDFAPNGRKLAVEFRADEEAHDVELYFAFRHVEEYAALRLRALDGGKCDVRLVRVLANQETVLKRTTITWTDDERAGWRRIAIETEGGELRARLGEREPIITPMPKALRPGFVGLLVHGDQDGHEPVAFRGLVLKGFE